MYNAAIPTLLLRTAVETIPLRASGRRIRRPRWSVAETPALDTWTDAEIEAACRTEWADGFSLTRPETWTAEDLLELDAAWFDKWEGRRFSVDLDEDEEAERYAAEVEERRREGYLAAWFAAGC